MNINKYVGKYVEHEYQDSQIHMINTVRKDLIQTSQTKALALIQYAWMHLRNNNYFLNNAFQKNAFGAQTFIPLN